MTEAHDATWQDWVGRTRVREDVVTLAPVRDLSATLDYAEPLAVEGEALPAGWHWLYFHEPAAASGIATDGHPERGEFLPPVPLPRRMWAGGRLQFHRPILVGDALRRESRIDAVTPRQGRSGQLVFVTVAHRFYRGDALLLEEEQDIVYREPATGGAASAGAPAAKKPDGKPDWSRTLVPDPVLLFRYSALTFNAHRIHYDRAYATQEEGYPGLVVQGPLTASLLLDFYRRQAGAAPRYFEFRGLAPLTDGDQMTLAGRAIDGGADLWALNGAGAAAMTACVQTA